MPAASKPTLLQAMRAVWATIGGAPTLWLDQAPEGTGYPRAVLEDGGEKPFGGEYRTDMGERYPTASVRDVTIRLFVENDSDAVEELAETVMQAYSPQSITLDFDANAVLLRRSYRVGLADERSKAGNPVYGAEIHWQAMYSTRY